MSLSPVAQYSIRKLLRQNIDTLKAFLNHEAEAQFLLEVNLDKLLQHLYVDQAEAAAKIQEIETLTQLYRDLEQSNGDAWSLSEIQRRIFQVLGFQSPDNTPVPIPIILREEEVSIFRFYFSGRVRDAIRLNTDLYGLVHQFPATQRLYVYQLAWVLSAQGVPLRLTTSPIRCGVWVDLRSPAYAAILNQDATFLKVVLSLYSTLRQCKSAIVRRSHQRLAKSP